MEDFVQRVTDFVASGSFSSLRENVAYYNEENYAVLVRTADFQTKFTQGLVYTDKHGYEFLSNSNLFGGELILPNIGASIGKVFIVPNLNKPMSLAPNSIMVKSWDDYKRDWLYFLFQSEFGQYLLQSINNSSAQGKFNKTDFKGLMIPIPGQHEMRKILIAINTFSLLIENINSNKSKLIAAVKQTRTKILELAVAGKLVPQNPDDEPASELLKRINPKAEIITDNGHYPNLPESWVITPLDNLCEFLSRGKSPVYADEVREYPVYAQKCNLKEGGISLRDARFLDPTTLGRWDEKYKLRNGDVLINSTGTGTVGRTRLFNDACLGNYPFVVPDSHVSVVRTFDEIESEYVYAVLSSTTGQNYLMDNLSGSTNQKELYINTIGAFGFPLPPKEQQRRIMQRINELFSTLDTIEEALQA